ncbi:MAG: hypothetical protein NTX50_21335 [Candidatus Sumerlaeota bacterium]|nr:hypothetical protein [Candidatus Sumerlaeota bacterium]
MKDPIPLHIAVEDLLSESVVLKILRRAGGFYVGKSLIYRGSGYLKNIAPGLNRAARSTPCLMLTDLDQAECPPAIIKEWLQAPRHPNFLLRVAVSEVESWVLAHRQAFAAFASIDVNKIPEDTDSIQDPKGFLIDLVRKSQNRELKAGVVPRKNSTARVGPLYNDRLCRFVQDIWEANAARKHSPSLNRAMQELESFQPTWMK